MFTGCFPGEHFGHRIWFKETTRRKKRGWTRLNHKRSSQSGKFYSLICFSEWCRCSYLKTQGFSSNDANFVKWNFNFRGEIIAILYKYLHIPDNGINRETIAVFYNNNRQVIFPSTLWGVPYNIAGNSIEGQIIFGPRAYITGENIIWYR